MGLQIRFKEFDTERGEHMIVAEYAVSAGAMFSKEAAAQGIAVSPALRANLTAKIEDHIIKQGEALKLERMGRGG